jgi:hypothetical protein
MLKMIWKKTTRGTSSFCALSAVSDSLIAPRHGGGGAFDEWRAYGKSLEDLGFTAGRWPGSWPRLTVQHCCVSKACARPRNPRPAAPRDPHSRARPRPYLGERRRPGRAVRTACTTTLHVRVHIVRLGRVRVPSRMWHGVFVQLCWRACHWQSRSRCICVCVLATTQLEDDPNPSLRLVNRGLSPGFVP